MDQSPLRMSRAVTVAPMSLAALSRSFAEVQPWIAAPSMATLGACCFIAAVNSATGGLEPANHGTVGDPTAAPSRDGVAASDGAVVVATQANSGRYPMLAQLLLKRGIDCWSSVGKTMSAPAFRAARHSAV